MRSMRNGNKGELLLFLTFLSALFITVGCSGGKDKPESVADDSKYAPSAVASSVTSPAPAKEDTGYVRPRNFRAEEFADKTFAILSGSSFDVVARETVGAKMCKYYNTALKAVEAVRSGEVDATLVEEPVGRKFAAQFSDVIVLTPPVDIENYAVIFPKGDRGKLRGEFNAFLKKIIDNGTHSDMVTRWVDMPVSPAMPDIKLNPTKGRKLIFATSDCDEPFSYKTKNGKMTGFDVELAMRFAQHTGYDIEFTVMEFPDIIPAVRSGRINFASNLININDERRAVLDFSEPIYYGGTVVLTKR